MAQTIRQNAGLLIGILNCHPEAAFPPRVILKAAAEVGIVPPWIDRARADPVLAAVLPPPAPATDPELVATLPLPAPIAEPVERPTEPPPPEGVELTDGDKRYFGSLASAYPHFPGMLETARLAFEGNFLPTAENFEKVATTLRNVGAVRQWKKPQKEERPLPDGATIERWFNKHIVPRKAREAVEKFRAAMREAKRHEPVPLPGLTYPE